MKKKILFIAGINLNNLPQGGEQYKNQLINKFLMEKFETKVLDTHNWKSRPMLLVRILSHILVFRNDEIIISLTTNSSLKLLRIINFLNSKLLGKVLYFTVGGNLAEQLSFSKFNSEFISNIKSIIVEGFHIQEKLVNIQSIANVSVIPNFKKRIGKIDFFDSRSLYFLYLGTITRSKGIFELMEVFERVSSVNSEMELHFYGPLDLDQEDKELFLTKLHENSNIKHKGYLKILNNEIAAYDMLSQYCAMVFPSYYPGEGFPGVFLDAFNVGMPVIASDWNMHTEVIKDGYNGKIVETKNNTDLEKAMTWFVENFQTEEYFAMCENARKSFDKYEYPKVLEEYFNDRNS
jgi:glycosyltransferase involved in cell wall biosynthesis